MKYKKFEVWTRASFCSPAKKINVGGSRVEQTGPNTVRVWATPGAMPVVLGLPDEIIAIQQVARKQEP